MTDQRASVSGYTRGERTLAKWNDGRTPDDGAPDETLIRVFWLDPDGALVTDQALADQLERDYQGRQG